LSYSKEFTKTGICFEEGLAGAGIPPPPEALGLKSIGSSLAKASYTRSTKPLVRGAGMASIPRYYPTRVAIFSKPIRRI
jgi:hypothetical protein